MKIEDFPYLREISVDYKHHIGGYMGGGSWAITSKTDANGDRARIVLGRGTSYRSHGDNVTFRIVEPNLETLKLQWTFFSGVKRFPDNWRRNQHFGYNSVIYAHFQQFKGRFEKPFRWDRISIHTTLSPQIFIANKNELGGLSGKPLTSRSTEVIKFISKNSNKTIPIIGVGGINTVADALEKFDAGAHIIQIYTGFIYEGPNLIRSINKALLNKV
mgnify:CR=1 FL=1